MKTNTPPEWHRLFNAALNDDLSEADKQELAAVLKSSAEARQLWFLYHDNECSLAELKPPPQAKTPRSGLSWPSWRPLTAAAAGLALGIFGSSMVWAYAAPIANRMVNRTIAVLSEGFEDPQFTPNHRFPIKANQWSGDLVASVEAEAEVTPLEGKRMMGLTRQPSRELSHAWRILDLADFPELAHAETRRLEVSAAFNTPKPAGALRYRLRLAAFGQEPTAMREIWSNESVIFDTMIEQVVRNVWTKPDDHGWQTVQAGLEIPPGTRSIVISLAAGATDPDQPPEVHYLDEISARFVIAPTQAE